jgi:hypothetical protein
MKNFDDRYRTGSYVFKGVLYVDARDLGAGPKHEQTGVYSGKLSCLPR